MLTAGEFVYAFLGYIVETNAIPNTAAYELQFLKQIVEDAKQYSWAGVLDWGLTIVDRIHGGGLKWSDTQQIAMESLVISRSVANAQTVVPISCVEYNNVECTFKTAHSEGRFRLLHVCSHCFTIGVEHAHTSRACHRKKANQAKHATANHSKNDNRSNNRPKHNRFNDYGNDCHEGAN